MLLDAELEKAKGADLEQMRSLKSNIFNIMYYIEKLYPGFKHDEDFIYRKDKLTKI